MRTFEPGFGMNGAMQQHPGMAMGLMNRDSNFQSQSNNNPGGMTNGGLASSYMNQASMNQDPMRQMQQQVGYPGAMQSMHPHMNPQMQQQLQQWQAAQMAAAQQNFLAQNGMYSVDVVRNQSMGADVFLIQAGNFAAFPMQAKKSRKRRQRDPLAPKPARYAWNFFFKEHYKKIRNKNYGGEHFDVQKAFTDIGHSLGDKWKALTAEEKEPYIKMAQDDKKRFEREMKEYTSARSGDRGSDDDEDDDASNADEDSRSPDSAEEATAGVKTDADSKDMENPRPSKKSRRSNKAAEEDEDNEEALATDPSTSDLVKAALLEGSAEVDGLKINIIRPGESAPTPPPNMTEMTADVLVTDDDETFIVMMSATLRKLHVKEGYQNLNIHVAHNGEEALKKIVDEKQRFAVVTMDKYMGEMDGVETVKKMREAGYDGCVVGVTGDESGIGSEFEKVGADTTLYKNQSGLFSQVHSIIVEKLSGKENENENSDSDEKDADDDNDKDAKSSSDKEKSSKRKQADVKDNSPSAKKSKDDSGKDSGTEEKDKKVSSSVSTSAKPVSAAT